MLKLYGSIPSPFVRRIRTLLHGYEYEFIETDVYDEVTREQVMKLNPTMKIPMLVDDGTAIFDSGIIFRYLQKKLSLPVLDWDQENLITLVNSANDSLVHLFMLTRSEVELDKEVLFAKLQHERIVITFKALDEAVAKGQFAEWHYPSICLYCLLDWSQFRELYDLQAYPHLKEYWKQHQQLPQVIATDPR